MRLGISGWRLQGVPTGVHRYLLNLLRHWAPGEGPFAEVTVYSPRPLEAAGLGLPSGMRVHVLESSAPMLVWENARLPRAARDDALFFPSHSRPLLARAPTVVTIHDALPAIRPDLFPRSSRLTYNRLYRWSARHAAFVITDAEVARRDLADAWGISAERIRVVPLAPAEHFRPVEDAEAVAAARERRAGAETPFFLFVGKASGRRDVGALVRAFAAARRGHGLSHRLLLVGPGLAPFAHLGEELGVGEAVVDCGFIPDEEL